MTASRYDVAKDQWSSVIRVQIHFNEAIQRTRQLTATAVVAAYGATLAYFVANSSRLLFVPWIRMEVHIASPLIILAFVFLLVGYILDRFYYFRMLMAAVKAAADAETEFDLPIKLSSNIMKRVKPYQADFLIAVFYLSAVGVGVFILWAINSLTVLNA
ncbi:hypothetical protein [Bosea sp. LjRoot237]|uniref:hypothetical protein n=1 Tax=Bosea sp. LjRoot237 TaxID=3342292 RepID=UPI003ECD5BD0